MKETRSGSPGSPGLLRSEFFVDPDVARASTLPARAFIDPAVLKMELETIFARSWQLVPERSALEARADPRTMSELVSRRGARMPFTLLDRPFFLQRDWRGKLHLFPNVCTHAWHTLVEGAGRDRTIVCPQHGRQFGCDGRFLSQAGFGKDLPDFPRDRDHLAELPVAEYPPFLLACIGAPLASLLELLEPLTESIAGLGVAGFRRIVHAGEVREVEGNWKQYAWNYMDKFHVAYIHRAPGGLADAVHLSDYRTELHRYSALQWVYAKDPAHGFEPARLPPRFRSAQHRIFALWWFIFPNTALNFYPWGLSVNVFQPVPERPERTLFLWYHFVADEKKYEQRDEIWLASQVDSEDLDAMVRVRRGVTSGFAPRGRFAPADEIGPHWFHRLVSALLLGDPA